MRTGRWVAGLLLRRPLELVVAALSVAVAIAFVASLGAFLTQSRAALTVRAASSVPVDWQVQVTPQGSLEAVSKQVHGLPDVRAVERVSFAAVPFLRSSGSEGVRQTGTAYVVSVSPAYAAHFPGELRHLLGSATGSMLFQQTAANLGATPGSTVTVRTPRGLQSLTVDGIVDMSAEDSFFQVVGLPPGAGVSAPPDNVLIVTPRGFRSLVGTAPVVEQLHVGFDHATLPPNPMDAALSVDGRAKHFQVGVAGGALVGDNLGTALTAAGEDARYADLLFLLLGLPGLALAVLVAAQVVSLRTDRRRREIALLRLRGARTAQIAQLVAGEGLLTATLGTLIGLPLALLAVRLALPAGTPLPARWATGAAVGGLLLAVATQTGPVLRLAFGRDHEGAQESVAMAASRAPRTALPRPLRMGLDVILLAGAAVAFTLTARSGYQVVLAPEGIPQTQVNFAALAGPALAWPGLALLVWRITVWVAGRRTGRWARGGPGRAPELEAAAVRQRRQVVARGAAGLAVAIALAISTAVFTATYRTQSRVDVALTVGSDVAVVEPPGSTVGPGAATDIAGVGGAGHVEPMQHRFAYVGPDLQDLYGVRAATFGQVNSLQDAFVPGSTIADTLTALRKTPDGVLLSAETLHDYQLHPGDEIRLRVQSSTDHTYRPVPFHVIGLVTEWPTAPKDSFIIANADYIAQTTGSDAVGTFLVASDTPATTAAALRSKLTHSGSAAQVQDVSTASAGVTSASGLAATDLSGLSRLVLGFGVLLAMTCSGLALLAGIVERRRALVLLAALGATARQRGRFLATEARMLVVSGLIGGAVVGATVAYLLVKVLTGIFDPPPASATIPWTYLTVVLLLVAAVTVAVVAGVGRLAARAGPSELRDL